jgi:hypothetical protein
MPWLIFEWPGRMTCWHQAQTSVGRIAEGLIRFFILCALESYRLRAGFHNWTLVVHGGTRAAFRPGIFLQHDLADPFVKGTPGTGE